MSFVYNLQINQSNKTAQNSWSLQCFLCFVNKLNIEGVGFCPPFTYDLLYENECLAALAALYLSLTLVSHSLTECHFRVSTQKVTFETWDLSDIWSEWCPDKKTKRQKDKKTKKKQKKEPKDKKTQKRVKYCYVRAVLHSSNVFRKKYFDLSTF